MPMLNDAAKATQSGIGTRPSLEARFDGGDNFIEGRKVLIVQAATADQFPNSLDRRKLRAVWRQKQQPQISSVAAQKRGQESCVMIARVVEYKDHASPGGPLAQQPPTCGD